jgi:hypothetical protein
MQRKLSPAHRNADVCDVLVGYYLPENLPQNPHPYCMCSVERKLINKNLVLNQKVKYNNGVYVDDKYKVEVYNMDVFS